MAPTTEPTNEHQTTGAATQAGSTTAATADITYCNNGVCEPGEDPWICPDDCVLCGDGVVSGDESCDNGVNSDPEYSPVVPAGGACASTCHAVRYCGDSVTSDGEECDEGGVQTLACEADCLVPVCGDGILNALAGETCDDGNLEDGDGCATSCAPERRVFLSSLLFNADFDRNIREEAGGIALADIRCNTLAGAADLPGKFKAWLSDVNTSPYGRFDKNFTGLYRLGSEGFPVVAAGWEGLTGGILEHVINANEHGHVLLGSMVWTDTHFSGKRSSASDCQGWTTGLNDYNASVGWASAVNATWTQHQTVACGGKYRIYCFEDHS